FPDHVGGRAYAYAYDGRTDLGFDHGAEYVGDLQNGIMKLATDLLPADGIVNGAALRKGAPDEVMYLAGKRYCFDKSKAAFGIQGVPPDIGLGSLLAMLAVMAEMTLIEWAIDVVEPWNSPSWVTALDHVTVEDWLASKSWVDARVRDLMRISVEALLSVEPSELSPFYLLFYTACNDGFMNEVNDDAGGPQQYWLRRGTSDLARRWAEPIAGKIRRGTRVETIDHTGDVVRVTTSGGDTIRARKVLVATSPRTASRITFDPPPPPERATLLSQPMGRTIKCQLFYRSRWWWSSNGKKYDGYVGGADYPVLWVMDNSPPEAGQDAGDPGPFVLMTFTVGAQADKLGANPSDALVTKTVTDALVFLFDDPRARDVEKIVIHRWLPSDPYVGGGPNTILSPGVLTSAAGRLLDAPWNDKIFFASAENARALDPHKKSRTWSLLEGSHLPEYDDATGVLKPTSKPPYWSSYSDMRRSLGYMDGAIASGRYAAHAIAASLGNAASAARTAAPRAAAPVVAAPPAAPGP
ncbi:MAG TPA: FAD-dependent oxidoreductase, partial [Minicystis sp.]|nr:FAD-dependent oxidoreductase [Minicystis sp.]